MLPGATGPPKAISRLAPVLSNVTLSPLKNRFGFVGAALDQFGVMWRSQALLVVPVQVRFATVPETFTMMEVLPGLFVQEAASNWYVKRVSPAETSVGAV